MAATSGMMLAISVFFVIVVYRYQKNLQKKQQELMKSIIDTQESEQERIAKDLHDHIRPLLSIVKNQLECIDEINLSELDKKIKVDIGEQLDIVINDVRSLAHNLIPKTFSEYGFLRSLEYYILRVKEYTSVNINLSCHHWPDRFEKSHEVALYCVIQELIQNSLKHASATNITIDITSKKRNVEVIYSDDGIGFSRDLIGSKGIGLKNIESRINFLSGTLEIKSELSKGTSFIINI